VDLRLDWPDAFRQAGHQADLPTAWLAEGLLLYLGPDENDRLLDGISDLSTPGSRLGLSAANQSIMDSPLARRELDVVGDPWPDLRSLWRSGFDAPPIDWLTAHGWRARAYESGVGAEDYGQPLSAVSSEEAGAGDEWLLVAHPRLSPPPPRPRSSGSARQARRDHTRSNSLRRVDGQRAPPAHHIVQDPLPRGRWLTPPRLPCRPCTPG
jgi:hypothetical protein